jgi:putative transposase
MAIISRIQIAGLSIRKKCRILEVHRSGLYYQPVPEAEENLELMRLMDEEHMNKPFLGVRRIFQWLRRDKGWQVNKKRIERLWKLMGYCATGVRKNTSKPAAGHRKYPYLLRGLKILRSNQVWAADITFVPMKKGFMYLVAIMDLYSRRVLNWSISNSMSAEWCAEVLSDALAEHGKPEIFNTDQGGQFTSEIFTSVLQDAGIRISMDGKGRATDNIFIERLWRSVKYEQVYLNPPEDGLELYGGLKEYFRYYNQERRHQSLEYQTPEEVYARVA